MIGAPLGLMRSDWLFAQDGRLQIDDQLLSVNDDDLTDKTNSEAMSSLRQAMHTEGPIPGHIKISVARKADSTSTPPTETTDKPVSAANELGSKDSSVGVGVVPVVEASAGVGVGLVKPQTLPVSSVAPHQREPSSASDSRDGSQSRDAPTPNSLIESLRNPVLERITKANATSNKLRYSSACRKLSSVLCSK